MHSLSSLEKKQQFSEEKLEEIKRKIDSCGTFSSLSEEFKNLCIYTTGSFARSEATAESDLDIFIIGENIKEQHHYGKIDEIKIFSELIKINEELKFPEFSNDGEFLKIFKYNEVAEIIGSPSDDHHNWFTARMLFILESKCIYNQEKYDDFIKRIFQFYLRDKDHDNFKLYFLLNDILRFWRTLCLNYEASRTRQKKWEKKNISLKFSRRLTVFATIIYIFVFNITSEDDLINMIQKTPWDRLKESIEKLNTEKINLIYEEFKKEYYEFLDLKEKYNPTISNIGIAENLKKLGESNTFKRLISSVLLHESIDENLRLFLIS